MTLPIHHDWLGKSYTFDDGATITIKQVKPTDDDLGGQIVTYMTTRGPGIPQKYVMTMNEFVSTFGHLFRDK